MSSSIPALLALKTYSIAYADCTVHSFSTLSEAKWQAEINKHNDAGKQLLRNLKDSIEAIKRERKAKRKYN